MPCQSSHTPPAWPKKEIEVTDTKTRKVLTKDGEVHPKSSTLRLDRKRKEGASEPTIQDETTKIQEYVRKMAPSNELLSE